MDSEIKAKWLEALRSGRYKQGRGGLRNAKNEFCCLGVLCDISGLGHWQKRYSVTPHFYRWVNNEADNETTFLSLPESLRVATGIAQTKVVADLIKLNDEQRYTFPEIADYIEKNL